MVKSVQMGIALASHLSPIWVSKWESNQNESQMNLEMDLGTQNIKELF